MIRGAQTPTLRVFFASQPLPPTLAIFAADLQQGLPGDRPSAIGPLYLAGFFTEAQRAEHVTRNEWVVVPAPPARKP
jgi:hypothetical protein